VTYDKREVVGHKQCATEHNSLRTFENNPPKSILQVQEIYVQNRQTYEVCSFYSKNLRNNLLINYYF